jgi:hypothetical protein
MDKRAEMIEAANRFIAQDVEGLRKACLEIPISIDWMAGKLADFHLSQSRDAWTPIHSENDLPKLPGRYLWLRRSDEVEDVYTFPDSPVVDAWRSEFIAWMLIPPYEQPDKEQK